MSCPANPLDCATAVVGGAIGGAASSAWDQVCKSFAVAASQLLGAFGKAFVAIPPVSLGSGGVRNVYAICLGLAAVVAALLLLGQVIRTAVTHDGSGLAQGLTGIGKAALAFLLTLTIAATALEAADQLTQFIVAQTFGSVQALSAQIANLVPWDVNVQGALLLIFAVIGIVLTIVLWFEMLLRNAAIAVLVATSPIAAAGQVSRSTQAWWPKLASSTAQLIVLKPVIALVFCVGLSLTGKSSDIETLLSGMLVLVLAVIAWPAVARFFTFASVQVGGSAGLGAVLGFTAARAAGGSSAPGGIEPDELSRRLEARTMAGLENAPVSAGRPGGAAAGTGGWTAGSGRAGLAVAAASAAQRASNALAGQMEQTAGHAGLPGANPYTQPAGTPGRTGHRARPAIPVPEQPGMPAGPGGPAGPFMPPPPADPGPGDAPPHGGTPQDTPPPGPSEPGPQDSAASPAGIGPDPDAAAREGPWWPGLGPQQSEPGPQPAPPAAQPPSAPPSAPEIHHEPPAPRSTGHDDTDRGPE